MDILDEVAYDMVEQWCRHNIKSGSDFLFNVQAFQRTLQAKAKEWNFRYESLHSFFCNLYVLHIMMESKNIQKHSNIHVEKYAREGVSILELSRQANFSPYMMSRLIVEEVATLSGGRKGLTGAMRDPMGILGDSSVISSKYLESEHHEAARIDGTHGQSEAHGTTTRLALEVMSAIAADPICGPESDRRRHMIGIEYEVILEEILKSMGIPFETESDLREKGASRTPDIVLQIPIGVQVGSEWSVVCWIDSKALYGDAGTHNRTVLPQAESYVHRFGPGMVLYWFGHAPLSKLGNAHGDVVIQSRDFPTQFLWPTGELESRPHTTQHNGTISKDPT